MTESIKLNRNVTIRLGIGDENLELNTYRLTEEEMQKVLIISEGRLKLVKNEGSEWLVGLARVVFFKE